MSSGRAGAGMPPGCVALVVLGGLLFLVPFFFAQVMLAALSRLGLPPGMALASLVGIFIGGTINLPVRRIEGEEEVRLPPVEIFGLGRLGPGVGRPPGWPFRQRVRRETVIAVNVGGCIIPVALAGYEIVRIVGHGSGAALAALGITAATVWVCWRAARPVPSVGIAMPAFLPPLVAAGLALLLVPDFTAPVAFVAGVLGPLIGADLLHLREMERVGAAVASIGGAGTFDGIVLSGMIAALLA